MPLDYLCSELDYSEIESRSCWLGSPVHDEAMRDDHFVQIVLIMSGNTEEIQIVSLLIIRDLGQGGGEWSSSMISQNRTKDAFLKVPPPEPPVCLHPHTPNRQRDITARSLIKDQIFKKDLQKPMRLITTPWQVHLKPADTKPCFRSVWSQQKFIRRVMLGWITVREAAAAASSSSALLLLLLLLWFWPELRTFKPFYVRIPFTCPIIWFLPHTETPGPVSPARFDRQQQRETRSGCWVTQLTK